MEKEKEEYKIFTFANSWKYFKLSNFDFTVFTFVVEFHRGLRLLDLHICILNFWIIINIPIGSPDEEYKEVPVLRNHRFITGYILSKDLKKLDSSTIEKQLRLDMEIPLRFYGPKSKKDKDWHKVTIQWTSTRRMK